MQNVLYKFAYIKKKQYLCSAKVKTKTRMKQFLTTTLALLMAVAMQGQVTFTASEWAQAQSLSDGATVTSYTSGNVTVSFDQGTSSNSVVWNATQSAIVTRANNTMTVSVPDNYAITSASFTMKQTSHASNLYNSTWNVSGKSQSSNVVSWTGSTSSIEVTVGGTALFESFSFQVEEKEIPYEEETTTYNDTTVITAQEIADEYFVSAGDRLDAFTMAKDGKTLSATKYYWGIEFLDNSLCWCLTTRLNTSDTITITAPCHIKKVVLHNPWADRDQGEDVVWYGNATRATIILDRIIETDKYIIICDSTDHSPFVVRFYGMKGELLKTEQVQDGSSATAPVITHECFAGWDKDFSEIHSDLDVYPLYSISAEITSQEWKQNAPNSLIYTKDNYTVTTFYNTRTEPNFYGGYICFTPGEGFTASSNSAFSQLIFTCKDEANAQRLAESTCSTGTMTQKGVEVHWSGKTSSLTITRPSNLQDNFDIASFSFVCEYYEQLPCTVIFVNEAGQEIDRQVVMAGESVTAPAGPAPADECKQFAGWDTNLNKITEDVTVHPLYETSKAFSLTAYEWNQQQAIGSNQDIELTLNGTTIRIPSASYTENTDEPELSYIRLPRRNNMFILSETFLRNFTFVCLNESAATHLAGATYSSGTATREGIYVHWTGKTDSLCISWITNNVANIIGFEMLCETVTNHTVIFLDRNGAEFDRQLVPDGGKATAPATNPEPENDCYTFTGWDKPFTKVIADLTISPVFELIEDCVPEGYAQVTFTDLYGNVLEKQLVQIGGTAVAPTPPTITFYQFIGWSAPLTNIQSTQTIQAQYQFVFDPNDPNILTVAQAKAIFNVSGDETQGDKPTGGGKTKSELIVVRGIVTRGPENINNGKLSFKIDDVGYERDENLQVSELLNIEQKPFTSKKQIITLDTVYIVGYVEQDWDGIRFVDGYLAYILRATYSEGAIFLDIPDAATMYDFSGNGLKQIIHVESHITYEGGNYYNGRQDTHLSLWETGDISASFGGLDSIGGGTIFDTRNRSFSTTPMYIQDMNHDGKPEVSTSDIVMLSGANNYSLLDSSLAVTNMDINRDGRMDYIRLDQSRYMANQQTAYYGAVGYQLPDRSFQEQRMQVFTWDEFVAQMTPEEYDQYTNPQDYSLGEVSRYTYVGTWGGAALARSPRRNAPGVKKAPGLGSMIPAPTKMIDLNKDGLMDLIDEKNGIIYTNMDNGKWVWTTTNGAIIPADLNNDGITDFIFPGEKLYTVIYNKNTNQLVQTLLYQNAASDNLVHCYDFDQDGDVDILATFTSAKNSTGYAYTCFFKNNGNGAFIKQPEQNYGSNNLWFSELQDIDGDGNYDLLAIRGDISYFNGSYWGDYVFNTDQAEVVWLKGSNNLQFASPVSLATFSVNGNRPGYFTLSAEDLDNDGKLEIWISGRNEGVTEFYPLPDNMTVTANTRPSAPAAPTLSYASGSLTVTWGNGSDDKTAVADLTYALRIGTTPGGNEILAAHANADGTRRNFLDGNMGKEHAYTIDLTSYTPATIYVAVQAIDAQHAGSVWSQEATVVHDLVPTAFALDRTTINFNETAVLTFTALPEGYTHAWTVQDGSYVQSPESATKLILSFTSGGEKTITHTVTTPNGGTLTASATIQVMPAGVGEPILFVNQWGSSDLPVYFSMPMADYNFDGRMDGIKGDNNTMTVMDGVPTESFFAKAAGLWNTNLNPGKVLWYDYNRDGALDLITSSSSDYGVLYHDATLPTLTARQTDNNLLYFFEYYSNSYNGKPFGRDMTHNGLYDSWMHSNRPELIELNGTAEPDWKQFTVDGDADLFQTMFQNDGQYLLYADFDHDGFTDIAAYPRHDDGTHDSKLNVFYNRGNAHFEQHDIPFTQSLTYTEWGYNMRLEDLNGDSYLDILLSASSSDDPMGIAVMWNNANQSFSAPLALPNADKLSYSNSGVLTDLDNNGYTDIIASIENPIYGEEHRGVYVWYMGAEGLLMHGFLLPDVQYSYEISIVNIAAGDRRLLVSNALYPIVAQADARPAAPTNIQASMTNEGLLITWDAAVDDHTPANLMRYNLAVKQQGATSYLISPQNGLNANAAFLPDYDYIEGTSYLIPTSYLNNGNYEITLQALDRQDQLSFFSETTVVPVTRNPIEVPSFVCADEDITVSYRGSETTGTPVWNFGDGVTKSGSGFGPYTVYWLSGGEKTVTLTLNGQTYTQTVTVDNIKSIEVSIPTVLYEETQASASVPEGIEYQWFASIASIDNGELYPINQYGIVLPTTTVFANYDKRLTAQGLNVTAHYVRNATNKTLVGQDVKLYLKVTNANYCEHYFYTSVTVLASTNIPTLTLVTTDASAHNVINWTNADAFTSVNVYKEGNSLNDFQLIGSAEASAGTYTDNTSDASQKAERYRLTGVTANGNESPESAIHKTVHLTINRGVQSGTYNLIWNEYAGATVSSYIILRGASPSSLTSIATVAASNTSYTDQAPDNNLPYYAIEYILSAPASAPGKAKAPANGISGRSNVVDRRNAEQGIEELPVGKDGVHKVLIDGQIYILRDDNIYTLDGQLVR